MSPADRNRLIASYELRYAPRTVECFIRAADGASVTALYSLLDIVRRAVLFAEGQALTTLTVTATVRRSNRSLGVRFNSGAAFYCRSSCPFGEDARQSIESADG